MGRDRGFRPADRRSIVMTDAREYRKRMRRSARLGTLAVWYDDLAVGPLVTPPDKEAAEEPPGKAPRRRTMHSLRQARTRDSAHVYAKRTTEVGGEPRIVADPPLIVPAEGLVAAGS